MLPVFNAGSWDYRVTAQCLRLDVFNPNASDSATTVDIYKGADVSETFDAAHSATTSGVADTLVYEVVDVFEELAVPPIVAEYNTGVERQLRIADED